MTLNISVTALGARPYDGSSNIQSFGLDMRPRPIATICFSPPDRVRTICAASFLEPRKYLVNLS